MRRVLAPDGHTVLWTLRRNEENIEKCVIRTLIDYVKVRESEGKKEMKELFGLDQKDITTEDTADATEDARASTKESNESVLATGYASEAAAKGSNNAILSNGGSATGTDVVHPPTTSSYKKYGAQFQQQHHHQSHCQNNPSSKTSNQVSGTMNNTSNTRSNFNYLRSNSGRSLSKEVPQSASNTNTQNQNECEKKCQSSMVTIVIRAGICQL